MCTCGSLEGRTEALLMAGIALQSDQWWEVMSQRKATFPASSGIIPKKIV